MSDETVKRIQALSRANPSLSELVAEKLKELCGEDVDFFAVILAKNSKEQTLVTTAAQLDKDKALETAEYVVDALLLHSGQSVPAAQQVYSKMKKVKDGKDGT